MEVETQNRAGEALMGATEQAFLCEVALFMLLTSCLGGDRCLYSFEGGNSRRAIHFLPCPVSHTVRRKVTH